MGNGRSAMFACLTILPLGLWVNVMADTESELYVVLANVDL